MKRLSFAAVLLFAAACSTTSSTETADSLAVQLDTVPMTDAPYDSANDVIEMTLTELKVENPVTEAQYSPIIAYNYRKQGLPVYAERPEGDDPGQVVGKLEYGEKVKLTKALVNYQIGDKIDVDGLKGRYIEVEREGGLINFVFSGYLSNLKVPALNNPQDLSPTDYFPRSFLIVGKPTKQTPADTTNEEMAYSYDSHYNLEGEMHVWEHGYYEGGGFEVTLPKNASMQEAWLILTSFELHKSFAESFPEFPTKALNEQKFEINRTLMVDLDDDGQVINILMSDNQGCTDETFITFKEGRIVIGQAGGC